MTYELIRRDPVWKVIPWTVPPIALAGGLAGWDTALCILALAFFMSMTTVWPHQRAMPFQAALPIDGRALFQARLISVLAMVWIQIAAGSAGALLLQKTTPQIAAGALAFGLYFTFLVIWNLTVRPEQCGGPSWGAFALWCLSLLVPALAMMAPSIAAGIAIFGAAASAGRLAWAWRRIPAGYQSAPYQAVAEKPARSSRVRSHAWRPVLGAMFSWVFLFFWILGLLVGLLSGQPLSAVALQLPSHTLARRLLRWLPGAGLPFRTRTLMALTTLPLVLLSIAVYAPMQFFQHGAGLKRIPEISSEPYYRSESAAFKIVTVQQSPSDTATLNVTVPFEYWRFAYLHPPEIRAPWGETAHPEALHFSVITIYNPYTVGKQNSRQFQAWQFERATQAVFGRDSRTPIVAQTPARILEFALLLAFAGLMAWIFELGDVRPFNRMRRVAFEGVFIAALTWPSIGLDVLGIKEGYGSFTEAAFKKILLLVCSPLPAAGVIAVSVLVATIPYLLLFHQFSKREIVGPVRQDNGWDY